MVSDAVHPLEFFPEMAISKALYFDTALVTNLQYRLNRILSLRKQYSPNILQIFTLVKDHMEKLNFPLTTGGCFG